MGRLSKIMLILYFLVILSLKISACSLVKAGAAPSGPHALLANSLVWGVTRNKGVGEHREKRGKFDQMGGMGRMRRGRGKGSRRGVGGLHMDLVDSSIVPVLRGG